MKTTSFSLDDNLYHILIPEVLRNVEYKGDLNTIAHKYREDYLTVFKIFQAEDRKAWKEYNEKTKPKG